MPRIPVRGQLPAPAVPPSTDSGQVRRSQKASEKARRQRVLAAKPLFAELRALPVAVQSLEFWMGTVETGLESAQRRSKPVRAMVRSPAAAEQAVLFPLQQEVYASQPRCHWLPRSLP